MIRKKFQFYSFEIRHILTNIDNTTNISETFTNKDINKHKSVSNI